MSERYLLYVVGATKSGTSWLYQTFFTHPDCTVRMVKEVHYWDSADPKELQIQVKTLARRRDRVAARLAAAEAEGDEKAIRRHGATRREIGEVIGILEGERGDHSAYLDYVLHADGPRRRVLAADITPSYATLPAETLREMAATGPEPRFLMILRDPLQRFWSHVRMVATSRIEPGASDAAFDALANRLACDVLDGVDEPRVLERGEYSGALTRLATAVPSDRLHIIFAEDMLTQPGFDALCDALGITRKAVPVGSRVHASKPAPMRADVADRAMARLQDQYDWAAKTLGPLPEAWQDTMTRIAA